MAVGGSPPRAPRVNPRDTCAVIPHLVLCVCAQCAELAVWGRGGGAREARVCNVCVRAVGLGFSAEICRWQMGFGGSATITWFTVAPKKAIDLERTILNVECCCGCACTDHTRGGIPRAIQAPTVCIGPRVRMPHSTPPKVQSGESHTHRLAGWALAERVQSSGQLGAKVVSGLQQGGVTPHLGLALVLLGVWLRCVVEPLDPLLVAARKELPARIRVEAALWCLLLLPESNGVGVAGQRVGVAGQQGNSGPTGPRTSVGADAADSRPRPRPPPRPRPRATAGLSPRAIEVVARGRKQRIFSSSGALASTRPSF